jgi:hypothetical protein
MKQQYELALASQAKASQAKVSLCVCV